MEIGGNVGNTVRAAGGTIRVNAPVRRDVVVAGGTIGIDETASISGDLVVNGGQINIQGTGKWERDCERGTGDN